jgi:lipoprotein-anchoring transpeptidase ErfK/SrfK
VKVGPIAVGHDTRAEALAALDGFLHAPLRFTFEGVYWSAPRARLGASFDPAPALIAKALAARAGSHLALSLTIERTPLLSYLAQIDRRFGHHAVQSVIRLVNQRALVVPSRPAVSVDNAKMVSAITSALQSGLSERLALIVTKTYSARTAAATKAVVVNLETQTLTAYLNGKPILKTPVTTGRPALPTPVGSYHALYKASPFVFHSPWPPGSPFWYPPTPVEWAIDFFNGDFLHDDPPEPTDAFGQGSEDGPYASHGCVHVPHDVMAFLFRWLPVGAQVVVAD